MSSIAAGTTSGTALVSTGNTAGTLVFQTNGTTTALTLGTDQSATFVGAVTAPSFSGTSSTATNLAGGSNGTIPYQSASGTTQMLAVGTAGQLLQTNGAGAPTWVTFSAGFTLGTPVASTSGTSITFTSIPAGTKQIIIMLKEVSTGGSDPLCVRIGDSGGIETSGYDCSACSMGGSNTTQIGSSANSYQIESASPAVSGYTRSGNIVLNLQDSSDYTWILSGTIKGSGPYVSVSAGRKSLSAVLDRVSVSSTSTSDSFSAGEINIAYI